MKRTLSIVALLSVVFMAFGQQLPNDPAVKTGKLANGMTYYLRHNELPKGRAEFYLATHVGAIQETPQQAGLAHFLEHMCFNGLKNLPEKQMLEYLQHIGAEFGRNINAATGVEQTQYMLNNIPLTREGILDTCLLIIHDYSHFVINDPKEIDAERGVILEEKRTRNDAGWRMFEKSLPYLYGDSKYATCNLIGSEENLKNFKPEHLTSFYETWYRPDMQAIVVVGDIDVEQVYGKIVKLFEDIPAPAQPTVKVMPEVPLNEAPVVGIITDPENTSTDITFLWKIGKPLPNEVNATVNGYVERIVKRIIGGVMGERFEEISSKADAPFLGASFGIGKLCETCETFEGEVSLENSKVISGTKAFLTEIEKMKRYGFNDDEVERVKTNILKGLKNRVEEASTRKNPDFINPIISNFFFGFPYMTPETELQMAEMLLPQLNTEAINQILKESFTGEHLTIIYSGIDKQDQVHPTEAQLLSLVNEVKTADIKANAAATISSDFLSGKAIKAGKIKKTATDSYGATVWTLNNGLKVIALPTEYKKNQIVFSLVKKGGLSLIPTEDLDSFNETVISLYDNCRGVGEFDKTTAGKMLTGKTLAVGTSITETGCGINGNCAPEDLETALQLVYLEYMSPRFSQEEWDVAMNQLKTYIPHIVTTPDYAFSKHLYEDLYKSPRRALIDQAKVEKASLDTYRKYYPVLFDNVNGAVMYIIGDFNIDTLRPLIEKYCGSLPKGKAGKGYKLENIPNYAKGVNHDVFQTAMTTPKASVAQIYSADVSYSVQKAVNLKAADFILDMIYTETLRESEGGTYGASTQVAASYQPYERATIQVFFDTNLDQQEHLRELAVEGLKKLAEEGPDDEQLLRAQENAKKNLPESRITNSWWMNAEKFNQNRGGDYDKEYEAAINNITKEGIQDALKEILKGNNFLEVVMMPE